MATETTQTLEQVQQELLETKAKLNDAKPDIAPKAKPYTKAEIAAHEKNGHVIGNPAQKLTEGHDPEDLKEWEQWECEVTLRMVGKIPETGHEHSIPEFFTLLKPHHKGLRANDKVFQTINKQTDFRYAGVGKPILYYVPAGEMKPGQKYDAHYSIEETRGQGGTVKHVRLFLADCTRITGITKKGNG